MTINQIECFVEAAKAGSISKAAEFLFITQQAASSQIRALEKELGFRVFERKNRGVSLTPEGELLFEEWQEIQTKYRISVDRAKDYHTIFRRFTICGRICRIRGKTYTMI